MAYLYSEETSGPVCAGDGTLPEWPLLKEWGTLHKNNWSLLWNVYFGQVSRYKRVRIYFVRIPARNTFAILLIN